MNHQVSPMLDVFFLPVGPIPRRIVKLLLRIIRFEHDIILLDEASKSHKLLMSQLLIVQGDRATDAVLAMMAVVAFRKQVQERRFPTSTRPNDCSELPCLRVP